MVVMSRWKHVDGVKSDVLLPMDDIADLKQCQVGKRMVVRSAFSAPLEYEFVSLESWDE